METRPLGRDGPQVPVMCFGAWGISGIMGSMTDERAVAVAEAALDAGLTFIDTAEGYSASESVIGRVIRGRRDSLFLATKLSGDHSSDHMRSAVENSLSALGTDYIDLYQLHRPDPERPIEETMGELMRLRDEGKIRYIGVSNFSVEQIEEALPYGPIASAQPLYNVLQRANGERLIPWCSEQGIGVLCYSPLGKGLLTGRYRPGHRFEPGDIRSEDRISVWQGENFERIYVVTERLREWAEDHGRDIVQLAIAWTLSVPSVTSTLVGARSPEQVYHNVRAADWRLTEAELAEIDQVQGDLRLPHESW